MGEKLAAQLLMNQYKKTYGPLWIEELSFDECNMLLKNLNHNKYPTLLSSGRPQKWALKLKIDDEEDKVDSCCRMPEIQTSRLSAADQNKFVILEMSLWISVLVFLNLL